MRLYLSADIEGTCGIVDWVETGWAIIDDYRPFAAQMTAEVAIACEGAVAVEAEDILMRDAHDSARNLDAARLPRQARMLREWTDDPLCMIVGLERGASGGVLFTGYHTWGCCGGNPPFHTITTVCDQATLNGAPASEFLINAYIALYSGVPMVFLSGDRELCAFAQDWLPGLVAVPVNEGRGGGVLPTHPQAAVEVIRAGAGEAVRRLRVGGAGMSVPLPRRFVVTMRYKKHKDAYRHSSYPGARLEDNKTISFDAEDWYEVLRFRHFVLQGGGDMSEGRDPHLAVLINADNAPCSALGDVMAEVAAYGTPTIKRIYGDRTTLNLASRKSLLLENVITSVQQHGYITGKNSIDSTMIVDAMGILYTDQVGGFALVPSDSDFTRLAIRLREADKKVYGMGEKRTPNPFIVVRDKFVHIEIIRSAAQQERAEEAAREEPKEPPKLAWRAARKKGAETVPAPALEVEPPSRVPKEIITLLADSAEMLADEDGYVPLGEVASLLVRKKRDFDPRNFGFSKLSKLVKTPSRFEADVRQGSQSSMKYFFVRDKKWK